MTYIKELLRSFLSRIARSTCKDAAYFYRCSVVGVRVRTFSVNWRQL